MLRKQNLSLRTTATRLLLACVTCFFFSGISAAPKVHKNPGVIMDGEDAPAGAEVDQSEGEGQVPQPRPVPPTSGPPAPITFTAYLSEGSAAMMSDVTWRIYEGHPGSDSNYKLLTTIKEPHPTVQLKPGEYLVNVSYGRANLTKKIGVWPGKAASEDFAVNAGGLRLTVTLAKGAIAADHLLKFEVFSEGQDQVGNRQRVLNDVRPGVVMRLNSGLYHVVSTYGDANSIIASDVVIEPGKITEAVIDHDAGKVTLKLVQRLGGEAVADTRWTIYNAFGEVVKESAGAFPTHVLAAGDYRVAAQHGERQYAGAFSVTAGDAKLVEVLMQ